MVVAFSLAAMLLQQMLDASSCGNICAFLVDLRSVACASRDMVTDAHWQHAAECLWPGATTVLFGSPAFQVRALLAKPSAIENPLRWIDPEQISTRDTRNCVLLEMRQNGFLLWRGTSKIQVHLPTTYTSHGYQKEETVAFNLPVDVGELLERRVVSWWQQAGDDWPPKLWLTHPELEILNGISDLAKELTVWLEVWYPTDSKPHVLRPSLKLTSIMWEKHGGMALMKLGWHMSFVCDERSPCEEADEDDGGRLILNLNIWRYLSPRDNMNSALEVDLGLQCESFSSGVLNNIILTSGYLSKLKSVC